MVRETIPCRIFFLLQELNPRRKIFFFKHLLFSTFNLEIWSYILLESSFLFQSGPSLQHFLYELACLVPTSYEHFFSHDGCLAAISCILKLMFLRLNFRVIYLSYFINNFYNWMRAPLTGRVSCIIVEVVVSLFHINSSTIWLEKSRPSIWNIWKFKISKEWRLIRN